MADTKTVSNFNILNEARRIITCERDGLTALAESLDQTFKDVLNKLLACSGKVIVSGMGKSGHIGKKAAATFASTGMPAIFIHPGEASHGDLGMIDDQDCVIALSNSGETKELSDLILYCHSYNIPLIAVTQNPKSQLARHSTYVLLLPKCTEACAIKLAPSTSSTMTLALLDSLALTLHAARGFTPKDFKRYHPGGKLGSSLVCVKDIMAPKAIMPLVCQDTVLSEVVVIMSQGRMGCVAVIDSKDNLVGLITDGDLRRHMSRDLFDKKASDIMTKNPKCIDENKLAVDALREMHTQKITSLMVESRNQELVGMIDIHTCLNAGIKVD
ncbi:MAG: KpsF/GutQ family sugar-phosphate isomerase [Rickettsiales bacterium]|nr:KpsF/GutQ family sugar-phosphate isomerase [Rickettsiales bacterium]|tara:strand:+ start:98805 stop:99791 length:987 start_codon:yes stop_codon:yes gene_type:complete